MKIYFEPGSLPRQLVIEAVYNVEKHYMENGETRIDKCGTLISKTCCQVLKDGSIEIDPRNSEIILTDTVDSVNPQKVIAQVDPQLVSWFNAAAQIQDTEAYPRQLIDDLRAGKMPQLALELFNAPGAEK